jgi:arabinose-5-phosphate isomerase
MGVFTDGDLRRLLIRGESPQAHSLAELMRLSRRGPTDPPVLCTTVGPQTPIVECRNVMEQSRITCLVVTDDANRPVGVVRMHDIVQAGVS